MTWRIFRFRTVEVGPPGLKVTAERIAPEREILYPLLVSMRDKRAILDKYKRADQTPVTNSIRHLRNQLNDTITALGPDASARTLLTQISDAIKQYLTAVELAPTEPDHILFAPALRDLRNIVRAALVQIADPYKLPIAAEIVDAMDAADAAANPRTRQLYEDPIAAAEGRPPS
jgi:hypothetical protein